jgi:DNA-binding SARP family transcriptional activator
VQGEIEACLKSVEGGLKIAQNTSLHRWDFLLSAQATRCSLVIGDLESAEIWTTRMANTMHGHSHINGGFYQHLRANAAVQRGDWQQAVEYACTGLVMAIEAGVPFLEGHCRIDLARALLGQGDEREWAEHLRAAHAIGQAMGSRVLEYLCLETEAKAAFQQGNEGLGLNRLAQALALSRAMEGATWLLAGPQVSSELYNRALAAGIEVEHVQRLIRRRRLTPPDPVTAPDHWPWPVRIYTLGRFEILCDDEPLRSSRKAQHKPLELIKILCALGGHAIHQDRVTDALWPDAAGDAAEQALATTLHRLRKLLHHEQAVRLEDRQLSLDFSYICVDALAFDRIAHHPNRADQASLQCTLNRYRGPFLEGESASWALAFRERLRTHFLKMSERFGTLLEQEGNWPAAIDCYHRVIEIEPVAESFYRRLMACHTKLGQRAEALAIFQRCRQALLAHLGISPTRETQDLYQRLIES